MPVYDLRYLKRKHDGNGHFKPSKALDHVTEPFFFFWGGGEGGGGVHVFWIAEKSFQTVMRTTFPSKVRE